MIFRSRRAAVTFVAVVGIVGLPLSLPILPASTLATVPLQSVNYNLGEMVGWPHMVGQIGAVYRSLPAKERAHAVILTSNYGEAGAVDRYGPDIGLPDAFSGHNSVWWWGRPPDTSTTAVFVVPRELPAPILLERAPGRPPGERPRCGERRGRRADRGRHGAPEAVVGALAGTSPLRLSRVRLLHPRL